MRLNTTIRRRNWSPAVILSTLAFGLATVAPRAAGAATIRVPADLPTIQAGITAANGGDTVLVAPGTYTGPGNRNLDFGGKNLRLVSAAGAAVTILDGELADARGIHFRRGETFGALVEGFTIRNFRPTAAAGSPDGAGILIEPGCNPLVQYCTFTGNVAADGRGGGMCTAGGSVQHCLFLGNGAGGGTAAGLGGGLFVDHATIFGCVIRENWASDLGASEGAGGGVALPGGSLTQCTIIGNRAAIGGGLFSECPFVSLYLTNCTIAGNFAGTSGGGMAIRCEDLADVLLDRCLVWGNGGCGVPDILLDGSQMTAAFLCSLVDPASVAGTGTPDYNAACVFADPMFCNPEECEFLPPFSDGYNLGAESPARAGNNACGQLIGASAGACAIAGMSEAPAIGYSLLGRPVPNPAAVEVAFGVVGSLPARSRIEVYDVAGRLVRTWLDPLPGAGPGGGTLTWDLRDAAGVLVPRGVYFVQLHTPERKQSRAVVVAR
jgi:hypothetical protein